MKGKKKVSIIIPIYNSELYLHKTVNSVLNQTYKDWEIILIDDASTDNSWKIIKDYIAKDTRIRTHRLDFNIGTGGARNKGIELAEGRYIAFLDSDDLWHPNKLEKQLNFMKKNKHAFTFTSYTQIKEKGEELKKIQACKEINYNKALLYNPIGCLTVILDTKQLGKSYMPPIRKRQDYALWLQILKKTNAYGLADNLAYYRIREKSISFNKVDLLKFQWQLFREIEQFSLFKSCIYLISNILIRVFK